MASKILRQNTPKKVTVQEAKKRFKKVTQFILSDDARNAYDEKVAEWKQVGDTVFLTFNIYRIEYVRDDDGIRETDRPYGSYAI